LQIQSGDFDEKVFAKKVLARRDFLIPVYYASVLENNGSGVPIVRVYANDSDLQANGNGLVLFHIPRRRNQRELFTIDSKEGVITTLNSLDYEEDPVHNITVLASDLGKPSLTSTALVIVDVVDMQEPVDELSSPIFAHRYYEMEVSLTLTFDTYNLVSRYLIIFKAICVRASNHRGENNYYVPMYVRF